MSYLSKVADFNLPHLRCARGRISPKSLASENYSPWGIVWHCLRDPMFSRFVTIPACDRHTQKHRHTTTACTALAVVVKALWFSSYVRGQANGHTRHNISHPSRERINNNSDVRYTADDDDYDF